MIEASKIKEHMEVLGSDGKHVGVVDGIVGQVIRLTRADAAAGGEHHFLHLDLVESVRGETVRLKRTTAQIMDEWGSETLSEGMRGDTPGSPTAGP